MVLCGARGPTHPRAIHLAIFGKNNSPDPPRFTRDTRKAKRFFEHAQTVADARNYDYAIDCYINGLRHDPDNMPKHEALREIALKRKVAGGKPAGFSERLKKGGRDAADRLMHAEGLWAKDPLNVSLMVDVMTFAVEADRDDQDLNLGELAYWVGNLILETNRVGKRPNKTYFIRARDLFAQIQAYDRAVEACRLAIQLDDRDTTLLTQLKDLEAERTIKEGKYGQDFRETVKDTQKQRDLAQEDAIVNTESAVDEMVQRRRVEFDEDPHDHDRLYKFVAALIQKGTEPTEREAVQRLSEAWDRTGQYRYKMRMGDIRMKQLTRRLRDLKQQLQARPDDEELVKQWRALASEKLRLDLEEYTERAQHYPTDLGLRYELGKRLYAFQRYDEAIGSFQQAKADPKHRAAAHEYLGRCYTAQGWYDEAIDTLRQGIESHPLQDDKRALSLRYELMRALREAAVRGKSVEHAVQAQQIASQILQTDIKYRDIRQQIDQIRQLAGDLRQPKKTRTVKRTKKRADG